MWVCDTLMLLAFHCQQLWKHTHREMQASHFLLEWKDFISRYTPDTNRPEVILNMVLQTNGHWLSHELPCVSTKAVQEVGCEQICAQDILRLQYVGELL